MENYYITTIYTDPYDPYQWQSYAREYILSS